MTLLLTWFNPFSWLISRMIKENHEHLADRQVLSSGINPAHYRAQLLNHTLGVNVFRLGNQFNHSLTIKRFKMMKKPLRSPMGTLKIALVTPAILLLLGFATGMSPQPKTVKGKVVEADSGEPLIGASVIIADPHNGNFSSGTLTDMKGEFLLNIEGDPDIVISFVGYKTLKMNSSKIGRKPLGMNVETYRMDLEKVPIMVKKTKNENSKADTPARKENHKPSQAGKEVFYVVEDLPSFRSGKADLKAYIYSNLEYPSSMNKKSITSEVNVQFLVNASGELQDIRAVSSTSEEFEEPTLEVFRNMPDWNPGRQRGKPVNVRVVVPVRFQPEI
jgi:TonB family protein